MRILVTGAGGFVGSRVATDLARAGHDVAGTWYTSRARLPESPPDNLFFRQVDLADRGAVNALFKSVGRFDAIVHAAAIVGTPREDAEYLRSAARVNVLAHANLLGAASETGDVRFIFTSSISVYGDRSAPEGGYREAGAAPTTYYGWSKRAAEELLDIAAEIDGITAVSLRLAGVHGLGRRSGALYVMVRAVLDGDVVTINEPESAFRWVFIDDVSQGVVAALNREIPQGHHVVNLASKDVFTLGELAERVKDAAGSESVIHVKQGAGARTAVMNIETAIRLLDFSPTSLSRYLPTYLAGIGGR